MSTADVDRLWDAALALLQPLVEAAAAAAAGPERLLVVDFLQLFRGTMERMGYLTHVLDALVEGAANKHQVARLTTREHPDHVLVAEVLHLMQKSVAGSDLGALK